MNKIFTSILMLGAAFAASAQNFTVSSVDGPVANGAVLTSGYVYNAEWEMYDWDPELTIHANKAGNYTVSATASESGIVQFCGFTGQCSILKPSVSRSGAIAAGQDMNMQLDIKGMYELLEKPVALEVTVTDGSETIKFTVNFVNVEHQAGLSAPSKAAGSLRFSGRTLNFSVENAATFTLYNISGRQVMSRALAGTGSVNLSAIPAGVYVYRCGTATGKVIIK